MALVIHADDICERRESALCTYCKLPFCTECSLIERSQNIYQCKKCSISNEYKCLFDVLYDILVIINKSIQEMTEKHIIDIIVSYGIGYIYNCCNDDCKEREHQILFDNKYDFYKYTDHYGDRIYWYKMTKFNRLSYIMGVNHIDKIRIFCELCTDEHLQKCQRCDIKEVKNGFIKCYGKDDESWIFQCDNHEKCNYCKKAGIYQISSSDEMMYCRTLKCQNLHHLTCSNKGICSQCSVEKERNELFTPIYEILSDILYDILINIITDYIMGFAVKCSNVYCQHIVHFQSKWEFDTKRNKNGDYIDYYELSKYNKLEGVYVYNTKIRVFCKYCKNKVTACTQIRHCGVKDMKYTFNINGVCHNHGKCKKCGSWITMNEPCIECNYQIQYNSDIDPEYDIQLDIYDSDQGQNHNYNT